jgi:hypothetical protein
MITIGCLFRVSNEAVGIALACTFLGIFALGPYPLALELVVECTYPVDQVNNVN